MEPSAGARLGRQARGEKVPSAFTVISHSMPFGASTMVCGFGIVSTSRRKSVASGSRTAERTSPPRLAHYPMRRGEESRGWENFLLSFSQPNFYFHATTAYDILPENHLQHASGSLFVGDDMMRQPTLVLP